MLLCGDGIVSYKGQIMNYETYEAMKQKEENMCGVCTDGRFDIIEKAKQKLLKATNIDQSPKEMKVLDSFLSRCWQMGWLKEFEVEEKDK